MKKITAIILTKDESIHIERCVKSLHGVVDQLVIVDSGSSDQTIDIARSFGCEIYFNEWVSYANQFNWALDNVEIDGDWILRIDADEYADKKYAKSLIDFKRSTSVSDSLTGFYVLRPTVFLGRKLRWGGNGSAKMLRLFKKGIGRCEQRWMDEHIVLATGMAGCLPGQLIDENMQGIHHWVTKHNNYATREALDLISIKYNLSHALVKGLSTSDNFSMASLKRLIKNNIYSNLSTRIRSGMYFVFRYFVLLGFLDGFPGFVYVLMQGYWYRLLVDIKIGEIENHAQKKGVSIIAAASDLYPNIKIS